jgi:pimeloyl-ACP methyl ester carboxylesterase
MAITENYADVNGVRLHYAETGSGKLVLMLHGFPEFWRMWRPVMEVVGQHHRAVAVDTRGINLSTGPEEASGYTPDQLVADVRALVHHLGHERAVLVGHDWGGFIAWQVAIRHPELLERLVIVNCAHPGIFTELYQAGGAQTQASAYIAHFRTDGFAEQLAAIDYAPFDALIVQPGLAAGTLTEADAQAYREAWRRPGSVRRGLNYYRAMGLSGAPPPLPQQVVRVPTLVIWGDRDIYFAAENVDRLPEVVPDLTLRRFPDNDHWIVQQRPRDVAELIVEFCGKGG